MLDGLQLIINFTWSLLQISIPVSSSISFEVWQYILVCAFIGITIKMFVLTIFSRTGGK